MPNNVSDWSNDPATNTSIDGVNIGEGCPPGNLNNAIRIVMAAVRNFKTDFDTVSLIVQDKLSSAAAVFTGTQPKYTGEGAMLHHADSGNVSGRVHILPEGSARPSGASNGDIVFYYRP